MPANTGKPDTRISATVDFERPGVQHGHLRLPYSSHDSAYGWIPIPISVIANGADPTVLLMAGNHGDEYEGQIALMKIIRSLDVAALRGRIIVLPAANFPAVMAGRRVSPLDNGNLNRSFPGNPNGTPTEMIAHYIEHVLLPMCRYSFDLHSGGSSLEYAASVHARYSVDSNMRERTLAAMKAFAVHYSGMFKPLQGEPRTMGAAAERNGVVHLNVEIGGGGTVSHRLVDTAENGVRRLLAHLGMIAVAPDDDVPDQLHGFTIPGAGNYIYCTETGLFEPFADLHQAVRAGDPAAAIHFPDAPWRKEVVVPFTCDGVVLCRRFPGWARPGDCLYQVGTISPDGVGAPHASLS
jgi:hypothetical protein